MVVPANEGEPLPQFSGVAFVRTIWPTAQGGGLTVTFLADTFTGFWCHYCNDDKRSWPCDRTDSCPGCKAKLGLRWQGYIPVWSRDCNGPRILMLTEGAARQLVVLADLQNGLRGVVARVFRKYKHPKAPIEVRFERLNRHDQLPASFEVRPHLFRLWNKASDYTQRAQKNARRRIERNPDDPRALDNDDDQAGALVPV